MVSAMAQFGNRKEAFSPARDALKGDETSLSYHRHKRYNRYKCDKCDNCDKCDKQQAKLKTFNGNR